MLRSRPSPSCTTTQRGSALLSVLFEAAAVALVGVSLAFSANFLSRRGLELSRDYFPGSSGAAAPAARVGEAVSGRTNASVEMTPAAMRLAQEGIGQVSRAEVKRLFEDPRRQQGRIAFIDARADEPYQQGHVPGAYQLDYYHPGPYLATVLPVCEMAEQIVVYCNGGDCEDSIHTAMFLRDAGVPAGKLRVYTGGIADWTAASLPIETGSRDSGTRLPASQPRSP